ncbi:MAG: glycosyltransferase family 2 protein [Gammaproteobacteria bacterium]|nr:glycosyltransferase family 2 protein [Gammaproteobacteria bacterium]MDH5800339.1 glycosyltransferase family 2 protein [Gammaproteobacteria bacterium]
MNQSSKAPTFAVLIPAYNEAATIHNVVAKSLAHTDKVIVVDDGSSDDTVAQLHDLSVEVLQNEQNCGKAASLWRGLQHAMEKGYDYVITLDGDGQHDPAEIPELIAKSRDNPNCLIIGARLKNRENAPKARLFANNFADFWVSWAAGQWVSDSQSGFRVYPAQLISKLRIPHHRSRSFVFESEIAIESVRHGHPVVVKPIVSTYHADARPSHFKPVADISKIVLMIAWKIIKWGLYPVGFIKALNTRPKI